jgi:hypothetical protein
MADRVRIEKRVSASRPFARRAALGPAPFTLVDHLIARAMVQAFFDEDYGETINQARLLARLAERGGGRRANQAEAKAAANCG